jgi:hypothetical protein
MHPVARLRHVLARRPWLYWAAVVVLAAGIALAAASAVAGVDDARRAWGATRQVVVAATDLAPGDPLAGRTEQQSHPLPMVPPRALEAAPPDAVARQHVAAGEVLVDLDLAAGQVPVALIPEGWLGVPVAEQVPTGAAIGDHVAAASGGTVLAAEAVVVSRGDGTLVVAVPADEAPAVAVAASTGDLTLLLVGR